MSTDLSIGLIERDINADHLWTWSFPGVSSEVQNIVVKRCELEGESDFYLNYKSDWVYIKGSPATKELNPDVDFFYICLSSKSFNPEKFSSLLNLLVHQYKVSADPTKVLEGYLSVNTTGKFTSPVGSFALGNFKDESVNRFPSVIKEMTGMLDNEIVLLWNAVLLKKRILIIAENTGRAIQIVRSLPLLAWHRQDWSVLRPVIRDEPAHIEDLTSAGVYIAGTVDESLSARSEMFDVIVTITPEQRRVNVTGHAQADMALCAFHKEVAKLMIASAENDLQNEQNILEVVAKKTGAILEQLRGLTDNGQRLTEAAINERVANKAAQQWLCRLATAEGLM